MGKYNSFGYSQRSRGSKVFWIILGIVAFAAIYFPFFGGNLRYVVGSGVGSVFTQYGAIIGKYLLIVGLLMFLFGFLNLILMGGGLRGVKPMILGFLLMVLATWIIDPGSLGTYTHGAPVPKGYH